MTSRIRKRPVSFGNPALGTYSGFVYTLEHETGAVAAGVRATAASDAGAAGAPPLRGAEAVERMVAMVDVPPEQVPEGILNLARSHRPFIEHVQIFIAEPEPVATHTEEDHVLGSSSTANNSSSSAPQLMVPLIPESRPQPPRKMSLLKLSLSDIAEEQQPHRSYLVLFHLSSEKDADTMVEDLHGRPYTSLDETVTCSVYTVVALEGEGGVLLLNSMFAPSTKKKNQGTVLETLPQICRAWDEELDKTSMNGMETVSTTAISTTSPSGTSSAQQQHLAEDPNCAVCLEHISQEPGDGEKTSILTTVCNHTFHLDCLLQCQDSPCPVCRYDHSGLNETLSQCHICGTTERNYVCLICGVVSCVSGTSAPSAIPTRAQSLLGEEDSCSGTSSSNGSAAASRIHAVRNRYNLDDPDTEASEVTAQRFYTSHANQHYDETLHAYALDTETQHVWDFAGQGYVHRLLQNKEDGKLVEVTDPNNTTSQERSLTPGLSDAQEGEVVHRKLEGFASQYYVLLKSQLEQQRTFYEGRLEEIRREFAIKTANATNDKMDLIAVLKQEKKQLSHRLVSVKRKKDQVADNVAFLKSMNESLEANKAPLEQKIKQAQREQIESREMIQKYLPALEEKVTTLMLQLEESLNTTCTQVASECAPTSL